MGYGRCTRRKEINEKPFMREKIVKPPLSRRQTAVRVFRLFLSAVIFRGRGSSKLCSLKAAGRTVPGKGTGDDSGSYHYH